MYYKTICNNQNTTSANSFLGSLILVSSILILFIPHLALAEKCCRCVDPQVSGGFFCIKDNLDCSALKTSSNTELYNSTCYEIPAAELATCRKIPDGICLNNPVTALAFNRASFTTQATVEPNQPAADAQSSDAYTPLDFKLNIDIPGLSLSAPFKQGDKIIVPMLAQYISAVHKLLIGISLIAAALMIVWGGFLYILSGTGAKVREGKQIIIDAVVGLIIVMGSYIILINISPRAAQLQNLEIAFIERKSFEFVSAAQYTAALAASGIPASPDGANLPLPDEVLSYARTQAQAKNIDPCIIYAIIMSESRGRIIIGHDENQYFGPGSSLVQSRLNFMRSRKFFSGKPFDNDVPIMPGENQCAGANHIVCQKAAAYPMDYTQNADRQMKNDDQLNVSAPPDYGLDWRFSHGIGAGQATIFPNSPRCPDGNRGFIAGGNCFTIPQLITKEGSVAAIFSHPAVKPGASPHAVFCGYGGRSESNCDAIKNLVKHKEDFYNSCPWK